MSSERIYRLDIAYPDGIDGDNPPANWKPRWTEDDFASNDPEVDYTDDVFRWPFERRFLSRSGAERRAKLLRSWGCVVAVVPSEPIAWPEIEEPEMVMGPGMGTA